MGGGSVEAGHIGVITPYEAQSNLIRQLLHNESLKEVQVANIDACQGRQNDVIVVSLVRSNLNRQLVFVDDVRRINVALARATRGLVVIGDKDTLQCGYGRGLDSLMRSVYERGVVIEMHPDPRLAEEFSVEIQEGCD